MNGAESADSRRSRRFARICGSCVTPKDFNGLVFRTRQWGSQSQDFAWNHRVI